MAGGSVIATYRTLAMIPVSAVLPGAGSASVASSAEVQKAFKLIQQFPADMDRYSGGMCQIDLSIRVISSTVPEGVFGTQGSANYIHPRLLADHLGDTGEYDALVVMNPSNLTTATTFRGVGGTSNGTLFAWVKIESQEPEILCHEFGHAMTAYLTVTTGEYTNFPVCGAEPAMHCAETYGYESDIGDAWLSDFMQGTIADGTGINATGWAVGTPTAKGNKIMPRYRAHQSPWGRLGPLHLTQ